MAQKSSGSQQGTSPQNELLKFIELFSREGWLNRNIKIKYQDKKYWMFCDREKFLTYQINENWGLGPGVPGWPVYMLGKDYSYDASAAPGTATAEPIKQDWLNIMANRNFELI